MSTRRPGNRLATPVPVSASTENGSDGQRNSVVLGPRDRLVGQLYIEGDLRISGTVDGTLEATGDIEIAGAGKVSGAVTASNRLVVGSEASLIGSDVRVGRLTVEDGATFSGHVSMGKFQAVSPPAPAPAPAPVPAPEPAPVIEPVVEPVPAEPVVVVAQQKPVQKGRRR